VLQIEVDATALTEWCADNLGSEPTGELFRSGYLSWVVGLGLGDGRKVVVKVRPHAERLSACVEVQRRMFACGFPAPEPLVGPSPLGGWSATAEVYRPGGTMLPLAGRSPDLFARALARLIATAPSVDEAGSLEPAPAWTAWGHEEGGLWPWPDDRDVDLNAVEGPAWLDDAASAVRQRLAACRSVPLIGHGDWYGGNLRWIGDEVHAVHDWDSLVAAPEAVIVGFAAAVFPALGGVGQEATIDESAGFLAAYQQARGRDFSADEYQESWAAGLWVLAFDAKKEFASDGAIHGLDEHDAIERRRLAGTA
jgi:hypothetical protein